MLFLVLLQVDVDAALVDTLGAVGEVADVVAVVVVLLTAGAGATLGALQLLLGDAVRRVHALLLRRVHAHHLLRHSGPAGRLARLSQVQVGGQNRLEENVETSKSVCSTHPNHHCSDGDGDGDDGSDEEGKQEIPAMAAPATADTDAVRGGRGDAVAAASHDLEQHRNHPENHPGDEKVRAGGAMVPPVGFVGLHGVPQQVRGNDAEEDAQRQADRKQPNNAVV